MATQLLGAKYKTRPYDLHLPRALGTDSSKHRIPKANAYMTCPAVQVAKIDFDATPEARTENRGDTMRRAGDFFRIEASVEMD